MMKSGILVSAWCTLALSCAAQPQESQLSEAQEIIENLKQAGFPADDIMVVGGKIYVGRDAEVSLAASREMLKPGDTTEEQYRTTNLVNSSITKICINGSTFTGAFSTALDLAIQNYDELPLSFAMARTPSSGCSFTINAVIQPGLVGGSAGFPSGGLPFSTINIGGGLSSYSVDVIEHVITHEIGHTIGFRHSDYYNRGISCGTGGDEGDAGVGATHIPGTPTTAVVGGSLMNSCFRSVETGEFASTDVTALQTLYPGAPPPPALDYPVAFQANTTSLWVIGPGGSGDTGYGMAAGTSPSLTRLTNGGIQVAFQANTGSLWTWGSAGTGDLGYGMAAGTSPSITALSNGGYQVAFQANTTRLWVIGPGGPGDTGYGMAAGTSPSIAALPNGGYQVAFQANTTRLWVIGPGGPGDTGYGMAAGTSPSLTRLTNGGIQVAFQANTGSLWTWGSAGTGDLGFGMAAGTSPSITALPNGGYQIAFQANTGALYYTGSAGSANTGYGMAAGTSPSIASRSSSGFDIAFQANTGTLWKTGGTGTGNLGYGMAGRTSPGAR
ncbi:M57 family metalloprotease [Archangium violaceum]|uniref:M57 family metalloprotease n=1 Tax=Archangium violaceum TaxID=83451 RepID=UPI0037C01FE3